MHFLNTLKYTPSNLKNYAKYLPNGMNHKLYLLPSCEFTGYVETA